MFMQVNYVWIAFWIYIAIQKFGLNLFNYFFFKISLFCSPKMHLLDTKKKPGFYVTILKLNIFLYKMNI